MRKAFSFFTILLVTISLFGQGSILERFTISQSNGNVLLTWIIEEGSTCNGIDITRSDDSLNYGVIGHIEGICGDEERAVTYKYIDEGPVPNSRNYYRLKLGSVGTSDVVAIDIIKLGNTGYSIRPNPFSYQTNIYLSNEKGENHELKVYDLEGKLTLSKRSNTNNFELQREALSPGMYFFTIVNLMSDNLINGKFIVAN